MGWAVGVARMGEIINARVFLAVCSKINYSEEQYMNERIILTCNLRKYDWWAGASWVIVQLVGRSKLGHCTIGGQVQVGSLYDWWAGASWVIARFSRMLLRACSWPLGFIKRLEISWTSEQLSAYQEVLDVTSCWRGEEFVFCQARYGHVAYCVKGAGLFASGVANDLSTWPTHWRILIKFKNSISFLQKPLRINYQDQSVNTV
jgi:hypothetical protein